MKLQIEHVRKDYDDRTILKDCTWSFNRSGVSVLMGPNGSGKSTLLRICALLERPDGGDLRYIDDGSPLDHDIALRRRMTLVLPRTGVFNTSVAKNVSYGLEIRNIAAVERAAKVEEALAFVGLAHKRKQHALTLSSGETQRLGIARALAIDPEILFLDEPTASVDQENTAIIESIILTMKKEGRAMIIMTTHDRDQAERLADSVLIIERGSLHVATR
jgi:tungstate transport system ATP-binding protein